VWPFETLVLAATATGVVLADVGVQAPVLFPERLVLVPPCWCAMLVCDRCRSDNPRLRG